MTKRLLITLAAGLAFCLPAAFGQDLLVVESENLRCNDSVLVFSPLREGERERDIPTLFLLHGWSGCFRDLCFHAFMDREYICLSCYHAVMKCAP